MFHMYRRILGEALALIGIIVGAGIILLLITGSEWPFVVKKSLYYGPYACKNNSIIVRANEEIRHLEGLHTLELSLLFNGIKINREDYNPEAIGYTKSLPWSGKCEPLVVTEKSETIDEIIKCLKPLIEKGILRKNIGEKGGKEFQLCGIAQFDDTLK